MHLSDSSSIQLAFVPPETVKSLQYEASKFEGEREFTVMTPIPSASLENAFGPHHTVVAAARIEAANMDIRPLQSAVQGLQQEVIMWDWNVRPLEAGIQTVSIRLEIHWISSEDNEKIEERFLVGRFECEILVVETYRIPTPYLVFFPTVFGMLGLIVMGFVFSQSITSVFSIANAKIPNRPQGELQPAGSGVFGVITEKLPESQSSNLTRGPGGIFGRIPQTPKSSVSKAIPPELAKRACAALLRCPAFNSNTDLRALFIDARISPWRNRISDTAATREARVNALIDSLHDQADNTGENALILFLHVLADTTEPADALHTTLTTLAVDLEHAQGKFAQS